MRSLLFPEIPERPSGGQALRSMSLGSLTCERAQSSGWAVLFTLFPNTGEAAPGGEGRIRR